MAAARALRARVDGQHVSGGGWGGVMGAGPGRFQFSARGTRFRVYAQSPRLGFRDEVVRVDAVPGSIRPGPADAAIDVIDAHDKLSYYNDRTFALRTRPRYPFPPGGRRTRAPAVARGGHFAHIRPGRRAFAAAMVFAIIRLTLEIWQHFLQRRVTWHFAKKAGPVLQVHPRVRSENAWSGDGFLEFGFPHGPAYSLTDPFGENLEVIAHETGHLVMKAIVGTMPDDERPLQHRAHEEAAADLIALTVALHFESVIAAVLRETGGFLFRDCLLARIGEWGRKRGDVARHAFNQSTLASVRAQPSLNKHQLSEPFTGAIYDLLVGIYLERLVDAGAVSRQLADDCRHDPTAATPVPNLAAEFTRAYRGRHVAFAEALRTARDETATLLGGAWRRTTIADGVRFSRMLDHLLAADAELGLARHGLLRAVFAARGIEPSSGPGRR
jgi:hypothetical protein